MSGQFNLPTHVPWCQVAVTDQMIDKGFGDRRFPATWRSSMAISSYEPTTEDLPKEFSSKCITYLKVTCTITGYQPTRDETNRGYADLDDGTTDFRMIFEEYLACYGVLLNVAVFPAQLKGPGRLTAGDDNLTNYPRIIAMEPKNRDLYQAASQSDEVLTASNSKVSTDKTLTQTESTEQGFQVEVPIVDPNSGQKLGGIKSSKSRTDADQESWSVQTDASRDRRETQGTTTQLSQMYNLLTGYHQGTNRATFLMLPRPHTLQATSRRTFIQGLRVIEGVTEFMLIIERPSSINSLCIEAFLETGHFSEDVKVTTPEQQFEEVNTPPKNWGPIYAHFDDGGWFGGSSRGTTKIDTLITIEHLAENSGFVLDITKGNLSPGITEVILPDDTAEGISESKTSNKFGPIKKLREYVVNIQLPDQLSIKGIITSGIGNTTTFNREFIIHLRKPITEPGESHTTATDLLITQRGLEVCIKSGNGCPEVINNITPTFEGPDRNASIAMFKESIVDERNIRVNSAVFTREDTHESQLPATKELLRQIQKAMMTSGRLQNRYPAGEVSFLDSDYFKNRITKILPRERMETNLINVEDLPDEVIENLGAKCTVAEALKLDLSEFARMTSLSIANASKARHILLGISQKGDSDKSNSGSEQSS